MKIKLSSENPLSIFEEAIKKTKKKQEEKKCREKK
jgi:hypothetical protein